jgi:hypothetical protein
MIYQTKADSWGGMDEEWRKAMEQLLQEELAEKQGGAFIGKNCYNGKLDPLSVRWALTIDCFLLKDYGFRPSHDDEEPIHF